MNLPHFIERYGLEGRRRGVSGYRIALILAGLALLFWGVLGWLPSYQAASFDTWRDEAITSGEAVGRVPADIHAEWVRTGLWTLFGLALLGGAWVLLGRKERERLTELSRPREPEPAEQALGALNETLSTLGEKVASLERDPVPVPPVEAPPPAPLPPPVSDSVTTLSAELGSDQSEVRLSALFSLYRLAQWDDGWRPAVLAIFSAYIRERMSATGTRMAPSRPVLLGGGRRQRSVEASTGPRDSTATVALDLFLSLPKQGLEGVLSLAGVDLRGCNFSHARLEGVDLGQSHLDGACLTGAHLEGANLSGVHGLDLTALREAHTDSTTLLPNEHRREQA
jgi:hypothetical protein